MMPSSTILACCVALSTAQAASVPQIDWRVRAAEPPAGAYDIDWSRTGRSAPPSGWGVYAVVRGQTLDFESQAAGWVEDPLVGPNQIEAGFGWRQPDMVLMFGFNRPAWRRAQRGWLDDGARDTAARYRLDLRPQSVVGFSLNFHLQ